MKKISKLLVFVFIVVALFAVYSPANATETLGPNLLDNFNPGFETGTDGGPAGWSIGNCKISSTDQHSGTNSGHMAASAFDQLMINNAQLKPNTHYRLSGWFKTATSDANIDFKAYRKEAGVEAINEITSQDTSGQWIQLTKDFTTGPTLDMIDGSNYYSIQIWTGQELYIDDLSLVEVTGTPDTTPTPTDTVTATPADTTSPDVTATPTDTTAPDVTPTPSEIPNLLANYNPGFETGANGDAATPWQQANGPAITINTSDYHSGNACGSASDTGYTQFFCGPNFNLVPNTTYVFSAWVKLPTSGANFTLNLFYKVNATDANNTMNTAGSTAGTGDWQYISTTFTAPATEIPLMDGSNHLGFSIWSATAYSIDDISLVDASLLPTPAPTDTPVVTDTPAPTPIATPVDVTSVSLNASSKTIYVGQSYTLKATLHPSGATSSLSWTSSNSKVATVSKGKVTAKKAGTATIKVTTENGKTATCKVTVKVLKITSLKLTAAKTLKVKKTLTVKVTIKPSNASIRTLTWKSSNTRIATVSSSGKVTGKKAGKVTITATTTDGSKKTAKVTITVK